MERKRNLSISETMQILTKNVQKKPDLKSILYHNVNLTGNRYRSEDMSVITGSRYRGIIERGIFIMAVTAILRHMNSGVRIRWTVCNWLLSVYT